MSNAIELTRFNLLATTVCVILIFNLMAVSSSLACRTGTNRINDGVSSADEKFIDNLFEDYSGERPGAVVMIAKGDQMLFCKAYGLADLDKKTPTTIDTNFRIGSVCKQFTAMAILKLVDQNKLSLDTKLVEVFPDFPQYANDVTIFHLLTHQSGLPGYGPLADRTTGKQLTGLDVLNYLKTLKQPDFAAGTRFQYCNSAFAVLGEVVARSSGVPFTEFMEKEIFVPAGMNATGYGTELDQVKNRASGYHIADDSIQLKDQTVSTAIEGDGSIYTSARDYFRWHLALNNKSIVSPELHELAYQPQKGTDEQYGFGWFMPETKKGSFVQHGGISTGFVTYTARIPNKGITVAIFTNRGWSPSNLPSQNMAVRAEALLSIATDREFPMPPAQALDDLNGWIRSTIRRRMDQNNVPAVSIGIIRRNKIKLVDGYGTLKRGGNRKVDADTVFQIASVSKMFTGIIVNELVDEGKLDLNESVATYLKDQMSEEASTRFSQVKLKHLVQHTAGVPHRACSIYKNTNDPNHLHWSSGYSTNDLIADINTIELEFEPGTKWGYSSSGYVMLGHVCEVVTGQDFESLLKKYVTDQHELSNTVVSLSKLQKTRIPTPYDPKNPGTESRVVDWGKATAPSGIFSSANDLTKLLQVHLEEYQQFGKTGKRSSLILTDHTDTDNNPRKGNDISTHYGLGLFKWITKNGTSYGHGGDNDGFTIFYEFEPAEGHGLVLMTSSGGRWFDELAKEINAKLNGQPYSLAPKKKSLAQSVFDITMAEGIAAGIEQFREFKNSDAYYFREDEMNNAGYALIQSNKVKDAIEIFKLNVAEFPESWNAYDSLGEAYLKDGNERLAEDNYKKSVELNPQNTAAILILKNIEKSRQAGDDDPTHELAKGVDETVRRILSEYHVPGMAVVIVKDGKTIFKRGYGLANVEKGTAVDPDKTLFRIGSISKALTL